MASLIRPSLRYGSITSKVNAMNDKKEKRRPKYNVLQNVGWMIARAWRKDRGYQANLSTCLHKCPKSLQKEQSYREKEDGAQQLLQRGHSLHLTQHGGGNETVAGR